MVYLKKNLHLRRRRPINMGMEVTVRICFNVTNWGLHIYYVLMQYIGVHT